MSRCASAILRTVKRAQRNWRHSPLEYTPTATPVRRLCSVGRERVEQILWEVSADSKYAGPTNRIKWTLVKEVVEVPDRISSIALDPSPQFSGL